MTHSKLNTVEAVSIILSIFAAHTLVSLPRSLLISTKSATIINLIYVGIIAIALTILIVRLFKNFSSCDIIDISEYLGGKIFKQIVGFIFIFYFTFNASILLRNFCEYLKIVYYPMTSIIFILLLFIIAVCVANRGEFESISKVNLIVLPFVLITVLFIFFANTNHLSLENIYPILGEGFFNTFISGLGNLGAFGGIAIIYFLPPYLNNPENFKKISLISIGISIIYLILCVGTILLMFSSIMQVDEIMPLYSAARYIEFGSFFQRLESIFILIWILEIVCYLSISIRISMTIFKKIANLSTSKPLVLSFGLLVFAIALFPKNTSISIFLENTVYKYLVLGIIFILSITILLLANLKKKRLKGALENEKSI